MTDLFTEPKVQLARKRLRVFAIFIDYLLFGVLVTIIANYFGERRFENGTFSVHIEGWPTLLLLAAWVLLFPVLENRNGQTLGKMLMKIRVVAIDGSKASFGQCLVRHLFDIIDALFLGLVGILVASNNSMQQRVGDLVAKTIVVSADYNSWGI